MRQQGTLDRGAANNNQRYFQDWSEIIIPPVDADWQKCGAITVSIFGTLEFDLLTL